MCCFASMSDLRGIWPSTEHAASHGVNRHLQNVRAKCVVKLGSRGPPSLMTLFRTVHFEPSLGQCLGYLGWPAVWLCQRHRAYAGGCYANGGSGIVVVNTVGPLSYLSTAASVGCHASFNLSCSLQLTTAVCCQRPRVMTFCMIPYISPTQGCLWGGWRCHCGHGTLQ